MVEHVDLIERMASYDKDHCWQYDIRLSNTAKDLEESGLTESEVAMLSCNDFEFKFVYDKESKAEITKFIRRHEWLGNMSQFPTHWFAAYYKGIMAGALVMNMPNAFSKLLGEGTKTLERLVSRGACISWSPKNLASKFLMWSVKFMVANTRYRLFTAYSDPTAKELGTIYQACNWDYLGQKSGAAKRYISPYTGRLVSDRAFRARSFYKRYATELGIQWLPEWNTDHKIHWELMPVGVEAQLREMSRAKQREAKFYTFPPKHKYAMVQGRSKAETRWLKKLLAANIKLVDYPKERGA